VARNNQSHTGRFLAKLFSANGKAGPQNGRARLPNGQAKPSSNPASNGGDSSAKLSNGKPSSPPKP
jgi:hypothetical protein